MDWTPEQITELTRLWGEGLTTSEIGKRLGISKNAVVGKAHRLHLSARPSPIKRTGRSPVFRTAVKVQGAPRPMRAKASGGAQPAGTAAPRPQAQPTRWTGELSNNICKWPIGHPGDADFHFCTDRALVGKPYCAEHCGQAFVKVRPKAGEAA
jgi:GcrA cell cycle regulator